MNVSTFNILSLNGCKIMLNFIFKSLILIVFLCSSFFTFSLPEINYYEILGVSMEAKPDEITRAYRRQAMKYHPDRTAELFAETADEKMAEINEAYEVLKNPKSRQQYDEFLSHNMSNRSHINIADPINFYFAFEQATSSYTKGFSKTMWFYIMNEMRDELNNQQVHSIVKVVVDVGNEYEMVRRAGITVLEHYFKQLYIEDIDLLLILSSSSNKIDDRDLKNHSPERIKSLKDRVLGRSSFNADIQDQNFEESEQKTGIKKRDSSALAIQNQKVKKPEKEIGIKKRAKRITDKWFAHKFQYSHYIDQILAVVTGTDTQYTGSDFFRKGALDALEKNVERLNFSQIQQLQDFSKSSLGWRRDRRLKKQIKHIVKKWEQLDTHEKGTALQEWTDDKRTLIRVVEEGSLYATDPELYNIKNLGDSYSYLEQSNLSSERVQQVVDYILDFIQSFESGIQFIRFIQKNDKNFQTPVKIK